MTERPPIQIGGSLFRCTCPDFAKSADRVISRTAISASTDREWTDSDAGSPEGVPCKHIYSVLRVRGELTPDLIPNDVPLERVEFKASRSTRAGFIGNQNEGWTFAPGRPRPLKTEETTRRKP